MAIQVQILYETVCISHSINTFEYFIAEKGGAHGVMVIVIGNGHGDMSSNPGRN